jgi:hypothetical protein
MTAKNKGRDRRDPKGKFDQHDTVNGGFVKPSRVHRKAKRGWQRGRR